MALRTFTRQPFRITGFAALILLRSSRESANHIREVSEATALTAVAVGTKPLNRSIAALKASILRISTADVTRR